MNILQRGLLLYLVSKFNMSGRTVLLLLLGGYALCLLLGYLLGSLNSAVVVSRLFFRDDVRRHGSGNAGLTNMFRVYGKAGALPTLIGDVLKTVLSVLIGAALMGFGYVGGFALGGDHGLCFGVYLAAVGCVLGHILPLYYGFQGGKGVLCAFTATAMLCPWISLILLAIFIVIVLLTKYISLGSMIAAGLFPVFLNPVFGLCVHSVVESGGERVEGPTAAPIYLLLYAFFVAVIVILCHRANLKRLWNNRESKFSFRRGGSASEEKREDGSENG